MLLRVQSLARGFSGVRSIIVQRLIDMLNKDIVPCVPMLGSVGASGDLAPMSHIGLSAMLGVGKVRHKGVIMNAKTAFLKNGLSPIRLEMKEGLALNNGVQFMTALGLHAYIKMDMLLKTACIATAMSTQVMLGADTPFRADLHELRPNPGAVKVARWIWKLMSNSPIREAHRPYNIDGEVQDPYNIRCAAQILGACAELIDEAGQALLLEANSVTDNPLILKATAKNGWDKREGGKYLDQYVDIVSGGHFHGMPVAIRVYNMLQAMAIMARLSNMRCARYVDQDRNKGLGSDLKWPGLTQNEYAVSSAMMIPEYTSAALTNWIWGACMPNHLFSISTDAGQEDHVSMGTGVAVRLVETLPRLAETLAIELAYATQAAAIRKSMDYIPSKAPIPEEPQELKEKQKSLEKDLKEFYGEKKLEVDFRLIKKYPWQKKQRKLNRVGEAILKKIDSKEGFPHLKKDRFMAEDIKRLSELVMNGEILTIASEFVQLG